MTKRILLGTLAVFVAWSILDFVIHGLILMDAYAATAQLWRPMEEMKAGLMYLAVLVSSAVFVTIYGLFVFDKGLGRGLRFGLLFGVGAGVSMGLGSYSYMPIPASIALVWFLGTLVEAAAGGLLAGVIVKEAEA